LPIFSGSLLALSSSGEGGQTSRIAGQLNETEADQRHQCAAS
jgi:hypothetical protein